MIITRILGFALVVACAASSVIAAAEPAAAPPANPDAWRFQAVVYGYLPSVDGTTSFPGGNGGTEVGVDSGSILDSLQFAFMGAFDARRGRWGLLADVVYADFGKSESGTHDLTVGGTPIPSDVSAGLNFELTGWCWTVVGTYAAVEHPHVTLQALAGARVLDLSEHLSWQLSGNVGSIPIDARQGDRGSGLTNWDAVIGAHGRILMGAKRSWFIPYYVDLGAGESRFTWQAVAGIGYSWSWGDVLAAWRHIDYDMKSGGDIQSLSLSGPAIGMAFRW
jgi:hypothetical protein